MRIGDNPLVSSRNCSPKTLAMNENRFLYGKHFYSFGIGTYLPATLGSVHVRVVVGGEGGTGPCSSPSVPSGSCADYMKSGMIDI